MKMDFGFNLNTFCKIYFYCSFCYITIILFIMMIKPRLFKRKYIDSNVVIVTAHPDDETMFFGPTIISMMRRSLTNKPNKIFLLCLSNGNYYGIGEQRTKELEQCCRVLGVEKVVVIDDNRLEDKPNEWWDESVVSHHIMDFVDQNDIQVIISFDEYGISGHTNHRVIYRVLSDLKSYRLNIHFYCLQSISILRKYLSFLEIPITLLFCLYYNVFKHNDRLFNVISFYEYKTLLNALHKHKTQMLWFRYLYCFTSRYMFVNDLVRI